MSVWRSMMSVRIERDAAAGSSSTCAPRRSIDGCIERPLSIVSSAGSSLSRAAQLTYISSDDVKISTRSWRAVMVPTSAEGCSRNSRSFCAPTDVRVWLITPKRLSRWLPERALRSSSSAALVARSMMSPAPLWLSTKRTRTVPGW